jgi:hypothetical protein
MVGESDTVSPGFSSAGNSLFWVGGFAFIFLAVAVVVSLFDQLNGTSMNRAPAATIVPRGPSVPRASEPSIGLTPETAVAAPATGG